MLAWVIILLFSLLPASVFAATIYVDPGCADGVLYVPATRACTGGSDTVKATISAGVGALNAGDKLFIRGGTYNSSFASAVPNGTNAAARTVISAYPTSRPCGADYDMTATEWAECVKATVYEPVINKGTSARIAMEGDRSWIVFEGLQFPGPHGSNFPVRVACTGSAATNPPTCTGGTEVCPHDIVIAGLTVQNSVASSLIGHAHSDVWVLANKVSACGTDGLDHCMYFTGIDTVVMLNEFSGSMGTGSQYYRQVTQPTCYVSGNNMVITRNIYRDNTKCGTVISGWNKNATYANNLSIRNSCGLQLNSSQGVSHKVYNNTLMNNGPQDLEINGGADNAIVKNNVYGTLFVDAGATGVTFANNYRVETTGVVPPFINPSANDYRVPTTDTLLVNQGQDLTAAGVTIDFFGVSRPQGAAFDIGYAETTAGGTVPFDFDLSTDVVEEEEPQIPQGNTADIEITVTLVAGTAGAVVLTAENLPPLTTASFSPTSCTPSGGSCTSTLTLDTAAGTPDQGYTIVVKGTTGAVVRTTQFDINVLCQ